MKEIQMKRGVAVVDDEDYNRTMYYHWVVDAYGYAVAEPPRIKGKRGKRIWMHRLIMKPPDDMFVDHKNGNRLDNRKENLRICTKSQNGANRSKQANNTFGYKGIRKTGKTTYSAFLTINGKQVHLGSFDSAEDAARAYDKGATEYFEEFASLNFP